MLDWQSLSEVGETAYDRTVDSYSVKPVGVSGSRAPAPVAETGDLGVSGKPSYRGSLSVL